MVHIGQIFLKMTEASIPHFLATFSTVNVMHSFRQTILNKFLGGFFANSSVHLFAVTIKAYYYY
jgi:hypothetical protein